MGLIAPGEEGRRVLYRAVARPCQQARHLGISCVALQDRRGVGGSWPAQREPVGAETFRRLTVLEPLAHRSISSLPMI
jgi:hypothetical protein